jgi:hypothetical protein
VAVVDGSLGKTELDKFADRYLGSNLRNRRQKLLKFPEQTDTKGKGSGQKKNEAAPSDPNVDDDDAQDDYEVDDLEANPDDLDFDSIEIIDSVSPQLTSLLKDGRIPLLKVIKTIPWIKP